MLCDLPQPNEEDMTNVITIHNAVNERCWQEVLKWEQLHKVRGIFGVRQCCLRTHKLNSILERALRFVAVAGRVRLPKVGEVPRAASRV